MSKKELEIEQFAIRLWSQLESLDHLKISLETAWLIVHEPTNDFYRRFAKREIHIRDMGW